MEPTTPENAVHQLAGRIANTGQVLRAWAGALGSDERLLTQRLLRASRELGRAVRALTLSDADFERETAAAEARGADSVFDGGIETTSNAGKFGLRGRSEMINLAEFVAFLTNLGKSGVLRVHSTHEDFVIELADGNLAYVEGKGSPEDERVDRILVRRGVLDEEKLERALVRKRRSELAGESLLRQGLITEEELRSALVDAALLTFRRMHKVGAGFDFHFQEGSSISAAIRMRLSVSHLLLESARRLDEERHGEPEPAAEPALDGEESEAEEQEPELSEAERMDRFRDALKEDLASDEVTLPVLPDSTAQMLALCWAEPFDAAALKACVQRDQTICAHVLKVANSAAYAPVEPITSVQLALTRLGLDKLREIAMALTLRQNVFSLPGWDEVIRGLWRAAAITSGFGGTVGKRCGTGAVRGSLVGLLQDVGKPVVLNTLHEVQERVGCELTSDVATELMDEFHASFGVLLAERWKLPEWIVDAMRHHDDFEEAGEHRLDVMVGHIAHELAEWAGRIDDLDRETFATLPVLEQLGIGPTDLDDILEESEAILEIADIYA